MESSSPRLKEPQRSTQRPVCSGYGSNFVMGETRSTQDEVDRHEQRWLQGSGHTSGQVRVVNQKHWVREMLEMPTRTPRALHIMRSVPGGSGTPSGNVATPLQCHTCTSNTKPSQIKSARHTLT